MNDHAWFRLLVSGVGLLLIGLSVPSIVQSVAWIATMFTDKTSFPGDSFLWSYSGVLAGQAFQFLFGVFLLRGGGRMAGRCIQRLSGVCAACGYDVRGVNSAVCPECGCGLPVKAGSDASGTVRASESEGVGPG
jgi:hypothetical protein